VPAPGDTYDALPYTEHAYAEAHPDRLAVVARLARWTAPDVATSRILELGCGRGGNLLPMASALPGATLVGVDRSRRQIDHARAVAVATGLRNVDLVVASFDDPGAARGSYDFVIAHGVCSWIPADGRRALLRAVAQALAPGGIGYVSFNVLPGWYERMAARDFLRSEAAPDPRTTIAWLRDQVSTELGDYRRRLDAVARRLADTDDAYAVHEYLADEHHPQTVTELLAEAAEAGLSYLGDAIPSETALELLPEPVRERASSTDVAGAQRLVDFVRDTAFRRALFVRDDDRAGRAWSWSPALHAAAIAELRVASRLRPHPGATAGAPAERFDGKDVSVQVADPATRRALRELAAIAPRSLPFVDLARAAAAQDPATLHGEVFDLWLATGAVDLHVHEPSLGDASSARPLACPVARWHAQRGGPITNRWHQEVLLEDARLRTVLPLLDGARTIDEVARAAGCSSEIARASVAALSAAALVVA
jgi:SAM-dependent methyltransferase